MRKIFFIASAMSILISQTGCFGSFQLVKKLHAANDSVDNKVLKNLFFYVLLFFGIYGGAAFIDIIVFNLIEFWSGSNPLSMEVGEFEEQQMTLNGKTYKVTATQNRMQFAELINGEEKNMGAMEFSNNDLAWSFVKGNESKTIATFNSDNYAATIYTNDGAEVIDAQAIECLAMDKIRASNSFIFASN